MHSLPPSFASPRPLTCNRTQSKPPAWPSQGPRQGCRIRQPRCSDWGHWSFPKERTWEEVIREANWRGEEKQRCHIALHRNSLVTQNAFISEKQWFLPEMVHSHNSYHETTQNWTGDSGGLNQLPARNKLLCIHFWNVVPGCVSCSVKWTDQCIQLLWDEWRDKTESPPWKCWVGLIAKRGKVKHACMIMDAKFHSDHVTSSVES